MIYGSFEPYCALKWTGWHG